MCELQPFQLGEHELAFKFKVERDCDYPTDDQELVRVFDTWLAAVARLNGLVPGEGHVRPTDVRSGFHYSHAFTGAVWIDGSEQFGGRGYLRAWDVPDRAEPGWKFPEHYVTEQRFVRVRRQVETPR